MLALLAVYKFVNKDTKNKIEVVKYIFPVMYSKEHSIGRPPPPTFNSLLDISNREEKLVEKWKPTLLDLQGNYLSCDM